MANEPTQTATTETTAPLAELTAFPGGQYRTIADLPQERQAQAQQVKDVLMRLEGVRQLPPGVIEQVSQKFEENDLEGAARILWANGIEIGNPIVALSEGVNGAADAAIAASGVDSDIITDSVLGNGYARLGMESITLGGNILTTPIGLTQAIWADLTREGPQVTEVHFDEARAEQVAAFFVGSIHAYEQEALAQDADIGVKISAGVDFAMNSLQYYWNHWFSDGTAVWKSYDQCLADARVSSVMPQVTSDLVSSGLTSELEAQALAGDLPLSIGDKTVIPPGPLSDLGSLTDAQTVEEPASATGVYLSAMGQSLWNTGAAMAGVAIKPFEEVIDGAGDTATSLQEGRYLDTVGNVLSTAAWAAGSAKAAQITLPLAGRAILGTVQASTYLTTGALAGVPGRVLGGLEGVYTRWDQRMSDAKAVRAAGAEAERTARAAGQSADEIAEAGSAARKATMDLHTARGMPEVSPNWLQSIHRWSTENVVHGIAQLHAPLHNAMKYSWIRPTLGAAVSGVGSMIGQAGEATHTAIHAVTDTLVATAADDVSVPRPATAEADAPRASAAAPEAPRAPTAVDYLPESLRASAPAVDAAAISALPEVPVSTPRPPMLDVPAASASDAIGDAVRAAAGDIHVPAGLRSTTPLFTLPEELAAAAERLRVPAVPVDVPGIVPHGPRVTARSAALPLGAGIALAGGLTYAMTGDAEASTYNAGSATPILGTGMAIKEGRTAEAWFRGITDAGTGATIVTAPAAATGVGAVVPAIVGGATVLFNEVGRPIAGAFGADVDPGMVQAGLQYMLTDNRSPQERLREDLPAQTDAMYSPQLNALIEARNAMVEAQERAADFAQTYSAEAAFAAEPFGIPMEVDAAAIDAQTRANMELLHGMTGEEANAAAADAVAAYNVALDAALSNPTGLLEVSDAADLLPGVTHLRGDVALHMVREAIAAGTVADLPESLRPMAERQLRIDEERSMIEAQRASDMEQFGYTAVPEFMAYNDVDMMQNRLRMELNGLAEGDPEVIAAADAYVVRGFDDTMIANIRDAVQPSVPAAPEPQPAPSIEVDPGIAEALQSCGVTGGDTVSGGVERCEQLISALPTPERGIHVQ